MAWGKYVLIRNFLSSSCRIEPYNVHRVSLVIVQSIYRPDDIDKRALSSVPFEIDLRTYFPFRSSRPISGAQAILHHITDSLS